MIERGSLWWVDLGTPKRSEPGYRRPVAVVSANSFNRSRIATVLCVILTRNVRLADAPGNVLLPAGTAGLPQDSVANVSQLVTLDKEALIDQIGTLAAADADRIDAGLRRVLEL